MDTLDMFWRATAGVGVFLGLACLLVVDAATVGFVDQEALTVAEVVSEQVADHHGAQAANLVAKLVPNCEEAARDHLGNGGAVSLPAQFVPDVARQLNPKRRPAYSYSLLSRWDLNNQQGLGDDFDRWAWARLATQDMQFAGSGEVPGPTGFDWEPAYRFESRNGMKVLRYLSAQPARTPLCVRCHNEYEQIAQVAARRQAQDALPRKEWKLHELMGAVRVEVPVAQASPAAAAGRKQVLASLGVITVVQVGLLFGLVRKRHPD